MWKALAEFASLVRTLGTSVVGGVAGVVVAAFASGVLWRADAIREVLLADGHTVGSEMVEPTALAVLLGALCVTVLVTRSCVSGLSPRSRLRSMADDVSSLAVALTDFQNYYWRFEGGYGEPLPALEAQIAIIKARLARLQIPSPTVSDGAAWRGYIPLLSGWVATGDLRAARAYRLQQGSTERS